MKHVKLLIVVWVLSVIFLGVAGCTDQKGEMLTDVSVGGIPATPQLKQAIEESHLNITGYGFTWQYAGMPVIFFAVSPTSNLTDIANKYGINADGNRLYDVTDLDGKGYIDKLPCNGPLCTLKALKDGIVSKVPYIRLDVSIDRKGAFKLMFFLPKAGMTWQETASLSQKEMLEYVAGILDVKCPQSKDNLGLLECKTENVLISIGTELGSVIYGVK